MPPGLSDLRSTPSVIGRIVTATITLVTVLIVYDGWATLKFFDVCLIVLGPIIAVVTSHVFSNSLVQQVNLGRRPTMREWLAVLRFESSDSVTCRVIRATTASPPPTEKAASRRPS